MNEPCTSQELIAYCLFGGIADKRKLLKDEADEPLSEIFERKACEARDCESDRLRHCCWFCRPVKSPSSPPGGAGAMAVPANAFNGATSPENSSQLGIEEFYHDPMLTCLIHQALAGNRELKILDQEIQIASNEVLARQGAYLPFVSFRGQRGAGQTQPLHARGSRREDNSIFSPASPFPIRCQISCSASTSSGSWTSGGSCGMPGTRQRSATSPPVRGGTTS